MQKLIRSTIGIQLAAVTAAALMTPRAPPTAQNNAAIRNYTNICKTASFARRPAGTMATTMRNLEIDRCIKNKGHLD